MKIAAIVKDSIVDGPGLRLTVFVQGCSHKCYQCQNPHTHDPTEGYEVSIQAIIKMLYKNPLIDGVTLSGGEPFDQAADCADLLAKVRRFNPNYSIWVYTGYTYEQILEKRDVAWNKLLLMTDVLVDGEFIDSLKSYELKFRGSSNQRLIDVKESIQQRQVILHQLEDTFLDKFVIPAT